MRIASTATVAVSTTLAAAGLALELTNGPARTTLAVAGQSVAVLGALGLLAAGALMIAPVTRSGGARRNESVSILPRRGGRPGRLRLPRRWLAFTSRAGQPTWR